MPLSKSQLSFSWFEVLLPTTPLFCVRWFSAVPRVFPVHTAGVGGCRTAEWVLRLFLVSGQDFLAQM